VMPFSSEPNELVRPVHNRMPVILRPGRRGTVA
jgi:putative SOS response-associated peptidase YedK